LDTEDGYAKALRRFDDYGRDMRRSNSLSLPIRAGQDSGCDNSNRRLPAMCGDNGHIRVSLSPFDGIAVPVNVTTAMTLASPLDGSEKAGSLSTLSLTVHWEKHSGNERFGRKLTE
jgi:hypothetical protein